MKAFFLVPYPTGRAPSQRFRFEQYLHLLKNKGIEFKISPFIDEKTWEVIYKKGGYFRKIVGILKGFFRRVADLGNIRKYDLVFIHRETAPIGPPIFEWIITKILKKKVIFDFDDAIWIPNYSDNNSFVFYLKRYRNANNLSRWAYKISCGNRYLCDHVIKYNGSTVLNPTTIDTEHLHNSIKKHNERVLTIGWTGTHSTIKYLNSIIPIIEELSKKYTFRFLVISDRDPHYKLSNYEFRKWKKDTEIDDLLEINVGLMPLFNDKWAEGKCGFKALQYNALGIPAVVSDIGVNNEIIEQGKNGFLCKEEEDWFEYLELILNKPELLPEMGEYGREVIEKRYSVKSNTENFLSLFNIKE